MSCRGQAVIQEMSCLAVHSDLGVDEVMAVNKEMLWGLPLEEHRARLTKFSWRLRTGGGPGRRGWGRVPSIV